MVKENFHKLFENPRITALGSITTGAVGYAFQDVLQVIMWLLASVLSLCGIVESINRQRRRAQENKKEKLK